MSLLFVVFSCVSFAGKLRASLLSPTLSSVVFVSLLIGLFFDDSSLEPLVFSDSLYSLILSAKPGITLSFLTMSFHCLCTLNTRVSNFLSIQTALPSNPNIS